MEVLILTIFVSLALAALGVGFFVWSVQKGTGEHAERLALLPLEPDEPREPRDGSHGAPQSAPSNA